MTEKENYLRVLNHQKPEWVPYYRDCVDWVFPGFIVEHLGNPAKNMTDLMSVKWTVNDNGPIAKTTPPYALEDINDWRKVVKLPDLDSLDWEAMAARDLAEHDPNKLIECMLMMTIGGCFFIPLMNMMGFMEGLCAMAEEPEVCDELFGYFCDYQEEMIDYLLKYYHPDIVCVADDLCSAGSPMISHEYFEEHLKPLYNRLISKLKANNIYVEFHMCGYAQGFVPDFVEMGVDIWQPAQPLNDLAGIKKQYGDRLVLCGAWQGGAGSQPGAPEEEVRASARQAIDTCAVGGGYVFWDGDPVGTSPDMLQKISWLSDEAHKYGKTFYA